MKLISLQVIPRREDRTGTGDRLSLDIGALKRQYARLRERQRQAHVILAAACARHAAGTTLNCFNPSLCSLRSENTIYILFLTVGVPTSPTSLTVNNLLLGKSAIVSSRGRRLGPPPGAVPPSRQSRSHEKPTSHVRVHSNETISWHEEKSRKTLSRRNSVKWKDVKSDKSLGNLRKASIDLDETGDGTIVSEIEANQMLASLRSRSSSETSSYSSHSDSSTDTSLCDENEKGSDSDTDILEEDAKNKNLKTKSSKLPISPRPKEKTLAYSPAVDNLKKTEITASEARETTLSVVKDITDYLDSAAGEPLRTYIDEFDTKSNKHVSDEVNNFDLQAALSPILHQGKKTTYSNQYTDSPRNMLVSPSAPALVSDSHSIGMLPLLSKSPTPRSPAFFGNPRLTKSTPSPINIEHISEIPPLTPIETIMLPTEARLSTSPEMSHISGIHQDTLSSYTPTSHGTQEVMRRLNISNKHESETIRHENILKTSVYLSPIAITPSSYDFLSKFRSPTHVSNFTSSRPPDIIDSLTMYENFVPDIDLSNHASPDPGNLPRSPDNESISVSEDEPPIQLKIDKYFEHSPEFFGARVTDPNNTDIPNRRSAKRLSRIPKKPESLTLQCNHSDKILKEEIERASSLPQSLSFTKILLSEGDFESDDPPARSSTPVNKKENGPMSPKDIILSSGRKNSERALEIIQENSKILSRILTKQNTADAIVGSGINLAAKNTDYDKFKFCSAIHEKSSESNILDSPILKESTSDSLIGYRKRNASDSTLESHDFVRIRPISIDDPFSLESRNTIQRSEEFVKATKSPSADCLGNKTDTYGWVNKAFQAKCERPLLLDTKEKRFDFDFKNESARADEDCVSELRPAVSSEWARHSFSGESRTSVTLPSKDPKDTSSYGRRYTLGDGNHPLSNKYSDYVLSAASDLCRKTINEEPKVCDTIQKTDESQASEFTQNVTSSISFTYEPSVDDDSLTGAKSNSSDTLCQIMSLDQVSTPISPKIFIKETPTFPKDFVEKSDKLRFDSDDTCSTITSLYETDTLSSLSYPRSPSTGSYHPFPTRPVLRMPKEIGVKLGLYPKDAINSAPK